MEISNLTTAFLEYKLWLHSPNSLSGRGFFYGKKGQASYTEKLKRKVAKSDAQIGIK